MTIAEELARERAAARRDLAAARGIDDLDDLDSLDVLDWSTDPWDDAEAAGVVERLRWQTRSVKWVAYTLLALTTVAILVAGLVGWWYVHQINPAGDPSDPVAFTVSEGDTLQSVSVRLQEQGFVEDAGVFRWYTDHNGGLVLTPGYYELRTSDHMGNLLARLRTPPSETYTKVTFPEGFTVAQIAERLDRDMSTMTVADVMAATVDPTLVLSLRPPGVTSLEGLLFPDTYQVSNGESPAHVLGRMIGQMERVANQEDIVTKSARFGRSPYEILIIASLVEREAKTDADRPKIARVIYNRIARGMPLAIDASVLYGTQAAGGDPAAIPFDQQRQTPGPWNTYLNTGLPPTPIANPGRASIRAALNPAANPSVGDPLCAGLPEGTPCEYLFYVLRDEEGNHAFAVTGEQHAANVQAAVTAGVL
ncbi:MAG TPA: endolytic transglycosylase MltG [Ilumatobacteraceae bacterium]|nr:endolytic transglycosylase MltG [Ilumatobacteraceae bacterium]